MRLAKRGYRRALAASAVLAALAACEFIPGTEDNLERRARLAAASLLIDPSSAIFLDVRRAGDAVCGELNARNRMGAYVGFSRFIVDTGTWRAAIEPGVEAAAAGAEAERSAFLRLWQIRCGEARALKGPAFDGSGVARASPEDGVALNAIFAPASPEPESEAAGRFEDQDGGDTIDATDAPASAPEPQPGLPSTRSSRDGESVNAAAGTAEEQRSLDRQWLDRALRKGSRDGDEMANTL
jgi:hypothetical protein